LNPSAVFSDGTCETIDFLTRSQ